MDTKKLLGTTNRLDDVQESLLAINKTVLRRKKLSSVASISITEGFSSVQITKGSLLCEDIIKALEREEERLLKRVKETIFQV
jgi:hypothetical protein